MRKIIQLTFLSLVFLISGQLAALELKGIEIPQKFTQKSSGKELVLNGSGIRTKFVFSIYVGALHVAQKSKDPVAIINSDSAKAVTMYFLYDKIEKKKLTDGWTEGFEENLSEEMFSKLKTKIDQFNSYFPDVVSGDIVLIDFLPSGNTQLTINNKVVGEVKGKDFQQAVLKIWLGNEPADEDLKNGMLGQAEE